MKLLLALLVASLSGCASLGLTCPGVIGAGYVSNKKNVVDFVYKDSPAEHLGIEVGDRLINPKDLSGSPGEIVEVEWIHGLEYKAASTTLICYNDLRLKW